MTIILDPKKFSELPYDGDINGEEFVPLVKDGENIKAKISDLPGATPGVQSIVAGENISVDDTDPQNPIVSATASGDVQTVNDIAPDEDGNVELDYADVGADQAGAAVTAAAAAEQNANDYTDTEIAAVEAEVSSKQDVSEKGQADGYASLDSGGKVPVAQLPSSIMQYKGTWNASTNSPTLADGVGDTGDVYRVSVAGTQNLGSGSITFDVGDYVIYNGSIWEKSDTTDAVASVFNRNGNVTAQSGDYTGSQVTNVPAGNISATNVQAAINELDTDKVDQPTYNTSHEYAVGFYGSRIGMNKWRMSTRTLKHIICWGDSVTQGIAVDNKDRSMVDGLRETIRNEFNDEVQEGFNAIYLGAGATPKRFTNSGGWSNVNGNQAANLSSVGNQGAVIRSTNNTLRTITWTRPSGVLCTSAIIHWVDDSTVTSGAFWSYSTDGGSNWTQVATASPGTATLKQTTITGLNNPSTIMIRNANAAGTTYTNSPGFMGIDIRHSDYGWVVHNMGYAGASLSLPTALGSCGAVSTSRATSNDWKSLFAYYQPELVTIEFSNDTTGYDQATFETAIETAAAYLSTFADLVAYGYPDQDRLSGGGNLATIRTHTRTKVLQYNGVALDMSARWTNMATAKANGFMPNVTFAIHPTELGDKDIASAMARLLRSRG